MPTTIYELLIDTAIVAFERRMAHTQNSALMRASMKRAMTQGWLDQLHAEWDFAVRAGWNERQLREMVAAQGNHLATLAIDDYHA